MTARQGKRSSRLERDVEAATASGRGERGEARCCHASPRLADTGRVIARAARDLFLARFSWYLKKYWLLLQ